MTDIITVLNYILPLLYLASISFYFKDFIRESEFFGNSKRVILFITLVIHVLYLLARTFAFDHPPITNKYEIFTVLAFSVGFSYFLIELLSDIRGTGLFILLFSVLFQIMSSVFIEDLVEVNEVLRNRFLGMHVIGALLGYSGITISAVYGILFIVLYRKIKKGNFGLIFDRMPSLETLEKLSFYALIFGFIFLSFSITIGIAWLPDAFPNFSYSDPKLISTAVVWFIYGAGIFTKIFYSWYGKKVIIFSITGFIISMFSLMLSNLLASSFHTFY